MKNSPATLADRNRKRAAWKASIDPQTIPRTVIRVCKRCKEKKPCEWNYSFTQTGKPEYRTKCQECHLRGLREHRKETRPEVNRRLGNWRIRRKQKAADILGGKCQKCGYDRSLRALTFHHRDPSTKVDDVGYMIGTGKAWSIIVTELHKCDLLCFNCHMEEEGKAGKDEFQVQSSKS